ncbi:hypothetical protein V6N13_079677 [Hibiscus sabdariffa]|uniref:Uncharacterized protein n=1 Tax=Hibiscus sabdariffa TaxID=183260 RepID=A0ABR2RS52_9ROSI
MEKVGVEFASVKEDLEGKIEVLLAVDHGDEAFGMEALGPGFNRGCDGVVLEEWGGRIYGGKINAGERSEGGVSMEESDQQSAMQFSTTHSCLEKLSPPRSFELESDGVETWNERQRQN